MGDDDNKVDEVEVLKSQLQVARNEINNLRWVRRLFFLTLSGTAFV